DAHRRPADGSHQRLAEFGDALQESKGRRLHAGGRAVQEIADVVAGAEHGLVPLHDHHANGGVRLGGDQCIGHGGVHRQGDRVLAFEPVQGDGHHAAFGVDKYFATAHGFASNSSLTKSSRSWPQYMLPSTKNVGAPNTPRATASCVTVFRRSLTCGSLTRASTAAGSKPACCNTSATTRASFMFWPSIQIAR